MSERDDELLKRYRALHKEAPPASIDASILAASRRAVSRPRASRWAVPVSIAAVLVLAFGVVMEVQRGVPDAGPPAATPSASPPAAPASSANATAGTAHEPAKGAAAERANPAHAPQRSTAPRAKAQGQFAPSPESRDVEPADAMARSNALSEAKQAPLAARQAAPSTTTPASVPAPPMPSAPVAARTAAAAGATAATAKGADPLLQELERIARLRDEGRDDDADKALEAFTREHPDYRIAPPLWERVKRKP